MKIKPLDIKPLLKSPGIIAVVGDTDSGKSNLVHAMIQQVKERTIGTSVYVYGLRSNVAGVVEITSLEELELIERSVIFLDEFWFLFGMEDRKKDNLKKIQRTFQLIKHKKNIIFLIGLPDNFNKFLSSFVNITIFKRCTISNMINGSPMKRNVLKSEIPELGSEYLNVPVEHAIVYDPRKIPFWRTYEVPYLQKHDTKASKEPLIKFIK